MLQKQNVPIDFGGNLDTKTDPKQAIPGSFTLLENAVRKKGKALAKRPGHLALGSTSGGPGTAVATFKNELLKFENHKVFSYSETEDTWNERGSAISCHIDTKVVYKSARSINTRPDMAYNNNITCYVYGNSSGGRYSLYDEESSSFIVFDEEIDSDNSLQRKVISFGDYFYIFSWNDTDAKIKVIDTTNPTGGFVDPSGDGSFNDTISAVYLGFDVITDGSRIFVARNTADWLDNDQLTLIEEYDSNMSVVASAQIAENSERGIAIYHDEVSDYLWVAYSNRTDDLLEVAAVDTSDYSFVVNASTIASLGISEQFSAITISGLSDNSGIKVFWNHSTFSPNPETDTIKSCNVSNSGTISGTGIILDYAYACGRAFNYAHGVVKYSYLPITIKTETQNTYYLIRCTDDGDVLVVAKFAVGTAIRANAILSSPLVIGDAGSSVVSIGNGKFAFTYIDAPHYLVLNSNEVWGDFLMGLSQTTFDFTNDLGITTAEVGDSLLVAGGIVSCYDGANYVEKGFHVYPEIENIGTDTGGALTAEKIYGYCAVYEWIDNFGKVHRSSPSVAVSQNLPSGKSTFTVKVRTLQLTQKKDVYIVLYRTEGDGTIFYKVAQEFNDPSVSDITFTDEIPDSSLITGELLYTTGGIIENIAPPSANFVATYRNRAVLTDVSGSNEAWISKEFTVNAPVEFSDLLTVKVPGKGKILGSATLDDKHVFFKEEGPYFIFGEGPNAAGIGAFSEPEKINVDVGLTEPKSIVSFKFGIAFKSSRGIHLLTRNLDSDYFGAPVEAYNGEYITDAIVHQDQNQVRFLTKNGPCLVFDYVFGQWSVYTGLSGMGCAVWEDRFVFIKDDGTVLKENYSVFTDAGVSYNVKATLGWLSFAGLQGFQRVYRAAFLGEYKSPHSLQIRVGYDFKDTYASTITFDASELSVGEPYQIRSHLKIQKCQAIRFEISETTDSLTLGSQEALTLSGLTLEVGVKSGINKLRSGLTVKAQ